MKKIFFSTAIIGLAFVGAGCSKTAPQSSITNTSSVVDTNSSVTPTNANTNSSAPTVNTNSSVSMQKTWTFPGALPAAKISGKQIRIKTTKGDIVFALYDTDAPKTVSNFVYLTEGGYYNGLTFHRREEGFVIQGGDPNGNGTGGPGYKFADEPVKRPYNRGIVAMANSGPNTNGSQFFIMLSDYPLPPQYTIFGMVTSGMDVVDKITVGDVMTNVAVEVKK